MQYSCLYLLPFILYPLLISHSQVFVFHVSLMISCALSRGDELELCYWCHKCNIQSKFNLK